MTEQERRIFAQTCCTDTRYCSMRYSKEENLCLHKRIKNKIWAKINQEIIEPQGIGMEYFSLISKNHPHRFSKLKKLWIDSPGWLWCQEGMYRPAEFLNNSKIEPYFSAGKKFYTDLSFCLEKLKVQEIDLNLYDLKAFQVVSQFMEKTLPIKIPSRYDGDDLSLQSHLIQNPMLGVGLPCKDLRKDLQVLTIKISGSRGSSEFQKLRIDAFSQLHTLNLSPLKVWKKESNSQEDKLENYMEFGFHPLLHTFSITLDREYSWASRLSINASDLLGFENLKNFSLNDYEGNRMSLGHWEKLKELNALQVLDFGASSFLVTNEGLNLLVECPSLKKISLKMQREPQGFEKSIQILAKSKTIKEVHFYGHYWPLKSLKEFTKNFQDFKAPICFNFPLYSPNFNLSPHEELKALLKKEAFIIKSEKQRKEWRTLYRVDGEYGFFYIIQDYSWILSYFPSIETFPQPEESLLQEKALNIKLDSSIVPIPKSEKRVKRVINKDPICKKCSSKCAMF